MGLATAPALMRGVINRTNMDARRQVLDILSKAESLIPGALVPDLPPKDFPGVPEYHDFEHDIWNCGEEIRPLLTKSPKLRSDADIQKKILSICLNKNAKRGRQSFIMLMGSTKFSQFAKDIVSQINDHSISGHVIDTLIKMRAKGYSKEVLPFLENETAWIRNKAKQYCEKYNGL